MTKQQHIALAQILAGSITHHTNIHTRVWNSLKAKGWVRLVQRQRVSTHNIHTGQRLTTPAIWYEFECEPTAAGCQAFNDVTQNRRPTCRKSKED